MALGREDLIAAARKLWGAENAKFTTQDEMRWGTHGSKRIHLSDNAEELWWHDFESDERGGVVELCRRAGIKGNGRDQQGSAIVYDYRDETNQLLFQVVRLPGHKFFQRRPDGRNSWINNLDGVRRVLYRLPQLIGSDAQSDSVFVCEGEKDADNLAKLGFITTTNPGGAGKWRGEYGEFLRERDVVILPDNDEPGRKHADMIVLLLREYAHSIKIVKLPGLGDKGDVSDWISDGGSADQLRSLVDLTDAQDAAAEADNDVPVQLEQFWYHSEENKCIFMPTGSLWPLGAVNARLPWIGGVKPSSIIAHDRPVEQSTWFPGEPRLIRHKLMHQGGWIEHRNATVFNQYRPPAIMHGDAAKAALWIDHVQLLYPDEAAHIIKWFGWRVQRPDVKINHALVLGGMQGIGKDTLLAPVTHAVGHWNVQTVTPVQLLEKFNGHLRSVMLLVSEARDLGEINRPQFYEHLKLVIAAPPDVLYINEKNRQQYYIPNLTGVVITTNHKAAGIYLSAEDRRHFVAWSDLDMTQFAADYFDRIWEFFLKGGMDDVAAYLHAIDLGDFDPKKPPPKTDAFWEIVAAGQHPECDELETVVTEYMRSPRWTTMERVLAQAPAEFAIQLKANKRMFPRWMEQVGYRVIRNPNNGQGNWKIGGKRVKVYGQFSIPVKELMGEILAEERR